MSQSIKPKQVKNPNVTALAHGEAITMPQNEQESLLPDAIRAQEIENTPPTRVAELSLHDTQLILKRPLPSSILGKLKDKGNALYIPWYVGNVILNKYCPGWEWAITNVTTTSDRVIVVGKLTLHCKDGDCSRSATGTEVLKELRKNKHNNYELEEMELAFGDPSSNAESMAFRRACARFGLALYLYAIGGNNLGMFVGKENKELLKKYGQT